MITVKAIMSSVVSSTSSSLLLLALLLLSPASIVVNAQQNYRCSDNNELCLSWTYSASASAPGVTYTVSSATHAGWLGIGMGPNPGMLGAKLYLGHRSGGNLAVTILSPGTQDDHDPLLATNRLENDGSIVTKPAGNYEVPNSILTFSFFRPVSVAGDPAGTGVTEDVQYIWGVSDTVPESVEALPTLRHIARGVFGAIPEVLAAPNSPTTAARTTSAVRVTTSTTAAAPAATGTGTALTGAQKAVSNFCNAARSLCVTAVRDATTNIATIAVQSTYNGWASIGVGSNIMAGATFYTAWFSSSGSLVVTQRTSNGYVAPPLSSNQGITIIPFPNEPTVVAPLAGAVIQYAFTRPVANDPSGAAPLSAVVATDFIWAGYSGSNGNNFPKHASGNYGAFQLDLSKVGTVSTGSATSSQFDAKLMRLLHGVFMFIAWGVMPYAGIFVARYLKDRMGHAWYLTHLGLMLGGVGVFTVAGLIAIELPIASGVSRFIGTWHGLFGTILALGLWPIQVALGFISNKLWSPNRPAVPWWDQLHWWMGRLLVVGSVAIMYYGLVLFEAPSLAYVGLFLWIGVCVIVLVAGQFAIGVVHHVAKPEENIGMNSNLGQAQGNHAYRGKV